MLNFAHANHNYSAHAAQADSPNYTLYIGIAVGLSVLIISIVLVAVSFKKKIIS